MEKFEPTAYTSSDATALRYWNKEDEKNLKNNETIRNSVMKQLELKNKKTKLEAARTFGLGSENGEVQAMCRIRFLNVLSKHIFSENGALKFSRLYTNLNLLGDSVSPSVQEKTKDSHLAINKNTLPALDAEYNFINDLHDLGIKFLQFKEKAVTGIGKEKVDNTIPDYYLDPKAAENGLIETLVPLEYQKDISGIRKYVSMLGELLLYITTMKTSIREYRELKIRNKFAKLEKTEKKDVEQTMLNLEKQLSIV